MYVELVENGLNDRGKIVPMGSVGIAKRDYEAYISFFPYDKTIVDYVRLTKSVKGHTGLHCCTYICIDIDNENDNEASRVCTLQVINRLNTLYGISPDDLYIYYSGNKGFHVNLVDRLIGIQSQYYENVGERCKSFVKDNFGDIQNIDYKIYEDHRILRIPNSRHAKTGLYKVEITFDELNLPIEQIKSFATDARNIKRTKNFSEIIKNERLYEDFKSYFSGVKVVPENRVDGDAFWGVMEKGNRNDGYYKQACSLFTYSQLSEQSIFQILNAINQASQEPLANEEMKAIVRSASRSKQKIEDTNDIRLYTFKDAVPLWLDSIKPEMNKICLGFAKFNEEMKGKLRGKVCDIIGYGGSKKSLLSQWIAYANIENKQRVLYSTMEMGIPDLMSRAINMTIEPERFSASYELEQLDRDHHEGVLELLDKQVSNFFGDKFLMTDSSAMTTEKYDKLITDISNKIGNIDILIVDGLGMMGGKEKEVERYSDATKELKELAKKWNILVILICHLSKGEDKGTKDMSRAIRGSEKIIDNCDFFISLSQHKMVGQDGMPDYNNPFGNARLVNKRGSGRVIDQFFEVSCQRLIFNERETPNENTITNSRFT